MSSQHATGDPCGVCGSLPCNCLRVGLPPTTTPGLKLDREVYPPPQGIALRDYFAGLYMAELVRYHLQSEHSWSFTDVAWDSYSCADAMLKWRERDEGGKDD